MMHEGDWTRETLADGKVPEHVEQALSNLEDPEAGGRSTDSPRMLYKPPPPP